MRIAGALVTVAGAAMLAGAQEKPETSGAQDGAVVVIAPDDVGIETSGPVPLLRGGVWQFDRSGTLRSGEPVNRAEQRIESVGAGVGSRRRFGFATCLPNDSLEEAMQKVAGSRSNLPNNTQRCGVLQIEVGNGKISGRRSCQLLSHSIGTSHSNLALRVSGRYDKRELHLNIYGEEQTDGLANARDVPRPATYRWQVRAHRTGNCAMAARSLRSLNEAADLLFIPDADGSGG